MKVSVNHPSLPLGHVNQQTSFQAATPILTRTPVLGRYQKHLLVLAQQGMLEDIAAVSRLGPQAAMTSSPEPVAAQTKRPYALPDESRFHVPTDESERDSTVAWNQRSQIQQSLYSQPPGQTIDFRTSEGKVVKVSARATGNGYSYTLNGNTVDVRIDSSYAKKEQQAALTAIIDYHAQSTYFAQDTFKKVNVGPPSGGTTLAEFKNSDKSLNFYGLKTISEGVFNHEVGHAVANKLSGSKQCSVPDGYAAAAGADGNHVSGYAKQTYDGYPYIVSVGDWVTGSNSVARRDDFAEAYAAYAEARETGHLAEFRKKFPHRAAYLSKFIFG